MLNRVLNRVLLVAMLASIATFSFAEDAAPVYDADSFPPQFDGQPDTGSTITPQIVTSSSEREPSSMTFEQRIARVEQQVNNMQSKNTSSKVEALQSEVQSLRGQVEQLTHQLQKSEAQQRTLYSDIDKRLASSKPIVTAANPQPIAEVPDDTVPANSPAASKATTSSVPAKKTKVAADDKSAAKSKVKPDAAVKTDAQPNVAEEQQIYQTAYDLIKAKKYNEAITALQKMLQKYPSGQFAANAHYWLGELYGLLGKNDQSAVEFAAVVKNYPDSPKVSDAQLKLGLIYAAQFKWTDAKASFKKVINRYPGTASSRLAAEQLKQIKEAGH